MVSVKENLWIIIPANSDKLVMKLGVLSMYGVYSHTSRVKSYIPEFIASDDPWLDHDAVPRYQQVANAFSSKEKLETMSNEDIADIFMIWSLLI